MMLASAVVWVSTLLLANAWRPPGFCGCNQGSFPRGWHRAFGSGRSGCPTPPPPPRTPDHRAGRQVSELRSYCPDLVGFANLRAFNGFSLAFQFVLPGYQRTLCSIFSYVYEPFGVPFLGNACFPLWPSFPWGCLSVSS